MSTTIDNRVVEMQFDNKNFEKNVQTSLGTIDKLNQSLKFTGASKGLENVSAAAKNVDMSGLSSSVETIGLKFNAMYTIADQALRNITNSAMAAGKKIISALTIDPIKTGFSEYETKINAIQTIMSNTSSKGTTMEDVTRVIGELNTYADKTIYNFAEMTKNIGTFTAAGVGLEESAAAIQGIANLAAASGSTSQQASTAMYQLSQALSAGQVKLMDWNSVVNAGMGGEKFQEALKATAREYGTDVDKLIEKNGSFRESLQEGWITADILNETLRKFTVDGATAYAKSMVESGKYTQAQADALIKEAKAMEDAATKVKTFTQLWDTLKESAQSGWSQTWEIIVGDFEEAKETLTKFSDVIGEMIGASANARNELLQGWKDAGGRADLIDSLYNVFDGIMSIVKPIKEAFREIFPPTTVDQLVKFTKSLKDLTAKFKLSEKASDNLKNTFKGLFSVLGIAWDILSSIFKAVGRVLGSFDDLGGSVLGVTGFIGGLISKIADFIVRFGIFEAAFKGVATVIKFVINVISDFADLIVDNVLTPILNIGDAADTMGGKVSSAFKSMGDALQNTTFFQILQSIWNGITKVVTGIMNAIGKVVKSVTNVISGSGIGGVLDIFQGLVAGGLGIGLMKLVNTFKSGFESLGSSLESFTGITDNITGILDDVRGCLSAYQSQIRAQALLKIAIAVGILAASIFVLSGVDSAKLESALGAITVLFADLMIVLAIFTKFAGTDTTGLMKLSSMMVVMSVAVLILASALKKLSGLDMKEIVSGLVGIAGLCAILVVTTKVLSSNGSAAIKGATQMVIFAAAVKILASACSDLAELSWEGITKGLVGVGILMAEISIFLRTAKFGGKAITTATGIVILAAALKIMASVCMDFAQMDWNGIDKGVTAIAYLLAELIIFMKLAGAAKNMISVGIGLIAVATAMEIFASVMQGMASLSWEGITKGLTGMGGALVALVIAMNLMPKNMVSKGIGLIAVATALTIIAKAVNNMSGMSWVEIGKGMTVLGGSMLILAVGLHAMKGTIGASAALLVAASSLAILVPVLSLAGSTSWKSIAKSLIFIAGAFTVLGVAGAILKPLIPTLLGLAAAMTLTGIGVLALGAGLIAAGIGLSAIAAGVIALVGALSGSISLIVELVASVIEGVCTGIAAGIVAFCKIITDGAPAIGEAAITLVRVVCDVIVECVPLIADSLLKLIVGVLDSLANYIPNIVDSLFRFVINLIEGLARNIPDFIKAVFNLVVAVFSGVIDALSELSFEDVVKTLSGIGLMAGVMAALSAVSKLVPGAMVGVIGMGMVVAELAIVLAAIGALASIPGLKWLVDEGADLMMSVGRAIGGLVGGIIGGVAEGITSALPQMADDLSMFMMNLQPFIDGARQLDETLLDGVYSLVGVILALTGANLLEGITSFISGGSSLSKFGEELAEFGPNMAEYADSIKDVDPAAIKSSAKAAKYLSQLAASLPNSGGLAGIFAGENDLGAFGEQLIPFGEGLKGFADAVSGIVPDNIISAASAASALAEMSNHIPNSGGMVTWFAGDNSVAQFGEELVYLGEGIKGFSDSVMGIGPENVIAAADAAKALAQMTEYIPNSGGMVSWFTGDNSVADFALDLVKLGMGLKGFSDAIVGVSPANLLAASEAAKSLAQMTEYIPNSGGIVSWFAGDNSVSKFAYDLIYLGMGLKGFSDKIAGVVPENLIAASDAAKALAQMTEYIPNSGGVVSWFTGDNSVAKFGNELISLGTGINGFSNATAGIIPENVKAAASAAKTLAEMAAIIPNSGGVVSWFAGDNSVGSFGVELVALGYGIKGFADATVGIIPENAMAAANVAKVLAEMSTYIPNSGGVASWFAGDNSVAKFGNELTALGTGIKGFSDATVNIIPENAMAAANVAKTLAEMSAIIPNSGGVASWFAGDNSVAKFGNELVTLGRGLNGFSMAVANINPESAMAAANVAKTLAELTNYLPDQGGIVSWFTGDNSIAQFGTDLVSLGTGLKGFADATAGANPESLTAAASAAKTLAEMSAIIPNSGGMTSWWSGDSSVAQFGNELVSLGNGLKGFADATAGIVPENVTAAANAAKALAEMSNKIPSSGGISAWFSGESSMAKFAGELAPLGKGLKGFSDSVAGINPENVVAASKAAKALVDMTKSLPKSGGLSSIFGGSKDIASFGGQLTEFGKSLKSYSKEVSGIDTGKLSKATGALKDIVSLAKSMNGVNFGNMSSFGKSLGNLGKTGVDKFIQAFSNASKKVSETGKNMMDNFIKGVSGSSSAISKVFASVLESALSAIGSKYKSFHSAGANLVIGFVAGISSNTYKAAAKARAMAAAAAKAAEEELDINSPSKVGYGIGGYFGLGFVNAISDYETKAYEASSGMAESARKGLNKAISKISNSINGEIDSQPTIRPIIDLSEVQTGASAIESMLGLGGSIAMRTSIGSLNDMMNRRVQNNTNDDIVSAIDKLGKDIKDNAGTTYTIDGVTYDDGSNIADAVKSIVRAARLERRI